MKPDGKPAIAGGEPVRQSPLGYASQNIGDREKEAVLDVLDSDYITRGPTVEEFEQEVAEFLGVEHAIAVTSGTAALHLAGLAVGLEPGDEVITTPFTFTATAYTAIHAGATPVFADVKADTRNIDPQAVRERITEDTECLVPVHYAGQPCDVAALLAIADDHDLTVIWDACHAFGSRWRDQPIGAQRDVATFSFHPVRNITTGEGGMVVTDDDSIAERVRSLRSFEMEYDPANHGDEPWYQVTTGPGYNYNMTDIQAAIGRVQLDRLGEFERRKAAVFEQYRDALGEIPGVELPSVKSGVEPLWHLFTVEIDAEAFGCSRKSFVQAMHEENVGVQVHYVPLHYHPYFQRAFGYEPGAFPVTERVYERIVSLPFFSGMSDRDVTDVLGAVRRIHRHFRGKSGGVIND